MDKFIRFKNFWLCTSHNLRFDLNSSCPKCSIGNVASNISIGNEGVYPLTPKENLTPSFPIKEWKKSKKVVSSGFTSNSQAITSNSQAVPIISQAIHKRKYVRKNRNLVFERYHNHGVKFDAVIDWDSLFKFPEFRLNNNVSYRRIDLPLGIVKVFKRSILITLRSSEDIKGLLVEEAVKVADSKIAECIKLLPSSIIISSSVVVSRHNAFVNDPIAKACPDPLKVIVNGETRFISDKSKGFDEAEFVSKDFAVSDSLIWENEIEATINRGLTKDFFANAINHLIEDRKYYAENLRSHVEAIRKLGDSVDKLSSISASTQVVEGTHLSCTPTFSKDQSKEFRLFRARQLLKEYGWGGSVWE